METTDIINMLAEFHEENPQNFEFNASMLLAGDANKTRRLKCAFVYFSRRSNFRFSKTCL